MMMTTATVPAGFRARSDLLSERVILLTGASGAIGEALAKAIAACGGQLILAGKTPRKLSRLQDQIVASGASAPTNLPIDLLGSGPDEYAQVAEAVAQQFGRLDGLVHLASVFKGLTPLTTLNPADWAEAIHVAVNAPFLMHQALSPLMVASNRASSDQARVIFALDDLPRVSKAYWGGYGVAKHALSGLLSIMADELEGEGIAVNGVIPPPVRSRLRQHIYMGADPGQPANPTDVVDSWLYLLDPACDAATGLVIKSDGTGQTD